MKTINLFFDFEFTSLSPDAQPISLGIVRENMPIRFGKDESENWDKKLEPSKSFYAEFTDFDLNRCDDWVKDNVVSKLKYYGTPKQDKMFIDFSVDEGTIFGSQNTAEIKGALHKWLFQFSDYNIQFVCDCGSFDWYWMIQLLAEWKEALLYQVELPENIEDFNMGMTKVDMNIKIGLPKLPANISPVPMDLNDLIALKKGISVREAFELDREELGIGFIAKFMSEVQYIGYQRGEVYYNSDSEFKHTALWDTRIIKAIYEKLK